MQTISKTDSRKYTLYGNTQSNNFECNDDKSCLMYTSGGNDKIDQHQYSKNGYVSDFDKKNDKIILHFKEWLAAIGHPNNTEESFYNSGKANGVIPLMGSYDYTSKMTGGRQLVIEGYSPVEVQEWVEILKAKDKYTDPITKIEYTGDKLEKLKIENPIYIQ